MQKGRRKWGLIFIIPQLIGLVIFAIIPLGMSFGISFNEWDGIASEMKFVGLQNYIGQVMDSDFRKSLLNTLIYSLLFIPIDLILALALALAVQKIKGKNIYRLFYFMPVVTGSVSVGVIWTWIMNGDFGLLNTALASIGIDGPKWLTDPKMVLISIVIVSVWWNVGYNMVLLLAGLQNIPEVYYEAAQIDGANKLNSFRHITVPMLSPTLFFVLIMTIISSFQVFDQAFVMSKGGPMKASYTLVYHIYQNAFVDFKMGRACASSVILFVIILTITLIQMYGSKRWVYYEQ
ncbi:carbohydrate ABC transporter permease [Anaerocolumna sp. MB42-C2]|uniref:carbohydrate ABC transporter permease n=1 Tax=Anaerocolumna sp. MB42-C2 TaxID=3070997 RepID=UPI0027E20C9F|nr:sugar ABC transporter permease [Anaerocolumna sp. MB42-C2]WMJ90417.1 sugar ABC transporter permease [Anaerocolumna sp. MB42-C2]